MDWTFSARAQFISHPNKIFQRSIYLSNDTCVYSADGMVINYLTWTRDPRVLYKKLNWESIQVIFLYNWEYIFNEIDLRGVEFPPLQQLSQLRESN